MDFLPEYTKQAEENLSKAIKLMPSKGDAWDALGHVFWKKRDLEQAKKCFEGSLEQEENNKVALRNLSMVYRGITHNSNGEQFDEAERKQNYKQSIGLANKAISLDMTDSQSWYVLGNAHLTNFFVNNEST
jgi:Flp pilus assembly protein TadD